MTVTFCGHGNETYSDEIRKRLSDTIEELILQGADEFLLGGYGSFDLMAAYTVRSFKAKYPHIKSVLVVPYIDRSFDKELYDYSEYPPLESVPKRLAILKRNEYMVNRSDIVIAYISHNWGGAAKTFDYAVRRGKSLTNIVEKYVCRK